VRHSPIAVPMGRRLSIVLLVLAIVLAPAASGGSEKPKPATRIFFSAAFVYNDSHGRAPDRQIYSIEPSGRGAAQLTFGATPASSPLPSPDGRRIVFSRQKSLWVMKPDGRGQRRLVVSGIEPAWTPDSRRIAYVALGPTGERLGIREVGADRKGDRLLVRGGMSGPAWSPDGRSLAFVDAGSVRVLREGAFSQIVTADANAIAWSPDARWLAYRDRKGTEITRLDDFVTRTVGGAGAGAPAWSPSGRTLAFLDPDGVVLYLYDLSTRKARDLPTPGSLRVGAFAWSPSGASIVYYKTSTLGTETPVGTVTLAGKVRLLPAYPQVKGLAWSNPPAGLRYRAPDPQGPIVSADELKARALIRELAADGDRVAFGSCASIAVWAPQSRAVTMVRREGLPLCFDYYYEPYSVALAGDRVAWGIRTHGLRQASSVYVTSLSAGTAVSIASSGDHGPDGRDRTGWVLGNKDLLSFSSRKLCEDFPDPGRPTCAVNQVSERPILAQTVWRIREPGWPGSCPFASDSRDPMSLAGPCQKLASEPGPLVPHDVDAGRIAAVGDNAVLILGENGTRLAEEPVKALAAQLSGTDLVVLVQGAFRLYHTASGELVRTWPLPDVPSGGACLADPCRNTRLRLEDVGRGLVAYVLDGKLHLLRLRDGSDAVVAGATAARFGETGLFYAYEAASPWRGRIRFVPFAELPLG
jgi:dipeptidyl aminopeptidase/acylaminoacyl peptidase